MDPRFIPRGKNVNHFAGREKKFLRKGRDPKRSYPPNFGGKAAMWERLLSGESLSRWRRGLSLLKKRVAA